MTMLGRIAPGAAIASEEEKQAVSLDEIPFPEIGKTCDPKDLHGFGFKWLNRSNGAAPVTQARGLWKEPEMTPGGWAVEETSADTTRPLSLCHYGLHINRPSFITNFSVEGGPNVCYLARWRTHDGRVVAEANLNKIATHHVTLLFDITDRLNWWGNGASGLLREATAEMNEVYKGTYMGASFYEDLDDLIFDKLGFPTAFFCNGIETLKAESKKSQSARY